MERTRFPPRCGHSSKTRRRRGSRAARSATSRRRWVSARSTSKARRPTRRSRRSRSCSSELRPPRRGVEPDAALQSGVRPLLHRGRPARNRHWGARHGGVPRDRRPGARGEPRPDAYPHGRRAAVARGPDPHRPLRFREGRHGGRGTNGTLLTDERIAALKAAGVRGVAVSVDSLRPAYHDNFRHGPGSLADTQRALARLSRQRVDFIIQTTVKGNRAELGALVAWAALQGAVSFNCYFLV